MKKLCSAILLLSVVVLMSCNRNAPSWSEEISECMTYQPYQVGDTCYFSAPDGSRFSMPVVEVNTTVETKSWGDFTCEHLYQMRSTTCEAFFLIIIEYKKANTEYNVWIQTDYTLIIGSEMVRYQAENDWRNCYTYDGKLPQSVKIGSGAVPLCEIEKNIGLTLFNIRGKVYTLER